MPTAEEFQAAQEAEWSKYVAVVPIDIGGARAFNPGDPVPVSHVTSGVVAEDQVVPAKAPASRRQAITPAPEA